MWCNRVRVSLEQSTDDYAIQTLNSRELKWLLKSPFLVAETAEFLSVTTFTVHHVQVLSADIQVSPWSGAWLLVAHLHVTDLGSWSSPAMFSWCKLLVPRSCTNVFGPCSFGSSSPTAWNDMPAHLHYSDLTLSDFKQLLKTALFGMFRSSCHTCILVTVFCKWCISKCRFIIIFIIIIVCHP